jgi:sugar phosphate isomerase/epimerase
MQPGLNCRTLKKGLSLEDLLDAASNAGFAGLEIRIADVAAFADQTSWSTAHDLFATRGIQPISFIDGLEPGLIGSAHKYEESAKRWNELCKAASNIGCHMASVIVNPRTDESRTTALRLASARLRELATVAANYGVTVGIEVLGIKKGLSPRLDGSNYFMDRFSQAIELASTSGSPNIGVILDAFHWYIAEGTLDEVRKALKGSIVLFHINDAPRGEPADLRDADRLLPGEGVIDLISLLSTAHECGFDGYVSIEIFNEKLWAMEPSLAAEIAFESVDRIIKNTKLLGSG